MNRIRPLTVVLLSFGCLIGCSSVSPSPDHEGVRRVLPALADSFNACDLGKVASHYAESVEFIAPDTPKPVIGRSAVVKHLSGACTAAFKPIMKVLEQRTYALGREGAVVSGTYSIGRSDRPADAPWAASFVVTLVGTSTGWLVQSQTTFPAPR